MESFQCLLLKLLSERLLGKIHYILQDPLWMLGTEQFV